MLLSILTGTVAALSIQKRGYEDNSGFKLPKEYLPFDLVSKYAKLSYCTALYNKPLTNGTTVSDVVGNNCASFSENESTSTVIDFAYTEPATGHRCLLLVNHELKTVFLSCKGMQTKGEIWSCAQILQNSIFYSMDQPTYTRINTKGMKIHQGFNKIVDRMRPVLFPKLFRLASKYPTYRLLFTGHSLGAAVTTLFAMEYYDLTLDGDRMNIYTFGQTRTGNSVWAQYVNTLPFAKNIFRITIRGDLFPHLPWGFLDYQHHLQNYQMVPSESYKVYKCKNDQGTGESSECLNDLWYTRLDSHSKYWYIEYDDKI